MLLNSHFFSSQPVHSPSFPIRITQNSERPLKWRERFQGALRGPKERKLHSHIKHEKFWTWPSTWPCSPKNQLHLGLHQEKCNQQVKKGDFSPLLQSPDSTCVQIWGSLHKKWLCCSESIGGTWIGSKWWNTSPIKKAWESWGCSVWRRKALERL